MTLSDNGVSVNLAGKARRADVGEGLITNCLGVAREVVN